MNEFGVVVSIGGKIASSLGAAIKQAESGIDGLGKAIRDAQEANAATRANYRAQIGDAVALGASLYGLIKPAVAFESAMADVRKVVDFPTPEAFRAMNEQIVAMSQRIPIAAEGLAAIVAAAGQSGIAREDLLSFTETAAQMATAFDISADQAGETMAKWRAGMGLSQAQAESLADAVNHLSNNTASNAADLAQVVMRTGPLVKSMGLATEQIAALGAAMLSAGAGPEIAATALKNFGLALTAGESATKSQRAAMEALGFEATTLAKSMQDDAVGSIRAVLEALREKPAEERGALAAMLFGKESLGAIAPLMENMQALDDAFNAVADATSYAGSMSAEYEARSATTANSLQLFQNRVSGLAITIGGALLPPLNSLLATVSPMITSVADLAAEYPVLTQYVVGAGAALAALKIATFGLGYAYTFLKGGALSASNMVVTSYQRMRTAAIAASRPFRAMGGIVYRAAIQARTGLALVQAGSLTMGQAVVGGFRAAAAGMVNFGAIVKGAATVMKTALISTGVGAIVVGLGMAAAWIVNNWGAVKDFFGGFLDGIKTAFPGAAAVIDGVASSVGWVVDLITSLVGPSDAAAAGARSMGAAFGAAFGGAIQGIVDFGARIVNFFGSINLFDSGRAILNTFLDGIMSMGDSLVAGVTGVFSKVRDLLPFSDAPTGPFSSLTTSGAGFIGAFLDGILSMKDRLFENVSGVFSHIRSLMPFSDAKVGPLSDLTLSGGRIVSTMAEGVQAVGPAPLGKTLAASLAGAVAMGAAGVQAGPAPVVRAGDPPVPIVAPAGTPGVTVTNTFHVDVTVQGGTPADMERQVRDIFARLVAEAEASQRAAFSD